MAPHTPGYRGARRSSAPHPGKCRPIGEAGRPSYLCHMLIAASREPAAGGMVSGASRGIFGSTHCRRLAIGDRRRSAWLGALSLADPGKPRHRWILRRGHGPAREARFRGLGHGHISRKFSVGSILLPLHASGYLDAGGDAEERLSLFSRPLDGGGLGWG